jgi:hypothetical protein
MVRRSASLDTDQAWRQLLKKRQDVAALQLPQDDYSIFCVDAVDLE